MKKLLFGLLLACSINIAAEKAKEQNQESALQLEIKETQDYIDCCSKIASLANKIVYVSIICGVCFAAKGEFFKYVGSALLVPYACLFTQFQCSYKKNKAKEKLLRLQSKEKNV